MSPLEKRSPFVSRYNIIRKGALNPCDSRFARSKEVCGCGALNLDPEKSNDRGRTESMQPLRG